LSVSGCAKKQPQTEETETEASYTPVEMKETTPVGVFPPEYTRGMIENELLLKATKTPDGYLLAESSAKKAIIKKYNLQGEFLWDSSFPYAQNNFSISVVILTNDGGFAYSISPHEYQTGGASTVGYPTVVKCDKAGQVLWSKVYNFAYDYAVSKIFETETNDFITIGSKIETAKDGSRVSKTYLSKLSSSGVLLKEANYEGDDYGFFEDAVYAKGIGLVAHVNPQTTGGFDFNGNLMCFNTSLELLWFNDLDLLDYNYDSFCFFDDAVYVFLSNSKPGYSSTAAPDASTGSKLKKFNLEGDLAWEKDFKGNTLFNFLQSADKHIILVCGSKLLFLDSDGEIQSDITFENGRIKKVIEYDDYCLVISENITGSLDAPPFVSAFWYTSELVYSGYDYTGKLLWRNAFDNTAETYGTNKYVPAGKDGVDDFIKKYKEQIGGDYIDGYEINAADCYEVTPRTVAEKAQCRIYKFSNSYASFLLCEGKVYTLGGSFGSSGLTDVVVCDFNKDGTNELLFTYSMGSGIIRSLVGHFDLKNKQQTTLDYTNLYGEIMLVRNWDYSYSLYDTTVNQDSVFPATYNLTAGKHLADIVYENDEIKVVEN
jgi:hypothetical protein